ncbi:TonB-dependent receptor [candidate division KSB1 bacterium]|nr:TonB-dependent receptor [candidate division KSB1 bacterium]
MKLSTLSLLFLLFINMFASAANAGLSGKITGRVLNQDQNVPMSGVEIRLLDTEYATYTDSSGYYFIINIPPGVYTVRASYLGYVPAMIENISIGLDETAIANFDLTSTIIDLGRIDTSVRDLKLTARDETNTCYSFHPDELAALPVETIEDLFHLLPGVTTDPMGARHTRSGRTAEIHFLSDGLSQMNPLTQSLDHDILLDEVLEIAIKTGAFNAEYGNALSAAANVLTRRIPSDYQGSFLLQTGDILSLHSAQFSEEIKSIDFSNNLKVEGSFGGTVPRLLKNKLQFYFSSRYWNDKGYLYGQQLYASDGKKLNTTEDADFVALNPLERFNLTAKLHYQIKSNMSLLYSSFYKHAEWQCYQSEEDHRWKFIPDSKLWHFLQGNSHHLIFTHQPGKTLYYKAVFAYNWNKNWLQAFESPDAPEYISPGATLRDELNEFYIRGTQNERTVNNASTLASAFNLNWQINLHHELRTGFEFKRHEIYGHDYFIAAPQPGSAQTQNIINPDSLDDEYRHHPMEFSLYVQDKIELSQLILNFGLRLEAFFPDVQTATQWTSPDTAHLSNATNKVRLSPRISAAYPFFDQGKAYFAYGHFFQRPPFWAYYSNQNFQRYSNRYLPLFGNGDLKPEKCIQYETGLDINLSKTSTIILKAFHRDLRYLLGYRIFMSDDGKMHAVLTNTDFGYAWGTVLGLKHQFNSRMSIRFDYTFQNAKMNANELRSDQKIPAQEPESILSQNLLYPDYLQPHSLKMLYLYSDPGQWGIGVYARIESGFPYTPMVLYSARIPENYNSERGPTQINVDLKFFKTFGLWIGRKRTAITLFLKCYNLLDNLNEQIVWRSSGHADKPIALFENNMSEEWMNRPYWYAKPRELLMGIKYEF